MLGAVLIWAIYTVGLQWRPAGVHPMLMLAALIVIGLLALLPAALWEIFVTGRSMKFSLATMASVLYVGIFPSFLGYIFYNRGVAEVGPNKASLFIHLMPVFGTLLSIAFLGETPQLFHLAGIALILSGIALTTRSGKA
jgi:drug/metabolite transporter (DMT)-like permease